MKILQIGCGNNPDHVTEFVKENEKNLSLLMCVDAQQVCVDNSISVYSFLGERLKTCCCAVSVEEGLKNFYFPTGKEGHGHSSLSKEHLASHQHQKIEESIVPCLNLGRFLSMFDFDMLFIDTEGFDAKILLDAIENKIKLPPYIEYEYIHTDGTLKNGSVGQKLKNSLIDLGYKIREGSQYNLVAEKLLE